MSPTDVLAWVVAAAVLLVLLLWAVVFVKAAFVDRDMVIAPFQVTGRGDDDGRLARSLALMLQARLRLLQRDFDEVQRALAAPVDAPADPADLDTRALLVPRLIPHPVRMSTMVLADSPSIDVKVAGIEFGGVAAWLSRLAARKRTLTVAVHFDDDEALLSATLDALPDAGGRELWLRAGANPGEVVTLLAHALLQRRLVESGARVLDGLTAGQFLDLRSGLSALADLNRRIATGGSPGAEEFAAVRDRLVPLLDDAPDWPELVHLVAQLTERTGDSVGALVLYERLRAMDEERARLDPALRRTVDGTLARLEAAARPVVDARETAFVEEVRAYEERLGLGPPRVDVVFMAEPGRWHGAQAVWNDELGRYEVDPRAAATDRRGELAKYTALMGRFMAQHYRRCLARIQPDFWNGFRASVVQFVITTEPDTPDEPPTSHPLFDALRRMARSAGVDAVRGLALRLLDRFDCDWDAQNLPEKLLAVGAEAGVPEDVVRKALAEAAA